MANIDFATLINNIKLISTGHKPKRKKKHDDIPSDTNNQENISVETKHIRFTISGFISLLTSILSIFYAFYLVVVVPRFTNSENNIQNLNQRITPIETNVNQLNTDNGELRAKTEDLTNRLNYHLQKDSVQKARNGIK